MSKRISKRMRKQAADLCQVMASFRAAHYSYQYARDSVQPITLERKPAFVGVAWDAFDASDVPATEQGESHTALTWAEAECLLRTGWSPK